MVVGSGVYVILQLTANGKGLDLQTIMNRRQATLQWVRALSHRPHMLYILPIIWSVHWRYATFTKAAVGRDKIMCVHCCEWALPFVWH